MTGAVLARAGINRKAAYATLAMTLAAEAPDMDVFWGVGGPVAQFEHHRGMTHTFLGLPFEAAILVGLVWGIHRWRVSRGKGETKAPVRWGVLYLGCLLALLSHILLDWTNNYGVRPFFPFNPRWYAGSFVFIFEPVLFGVLLLALVGPWFFGLIGNEVGERKPKFRGQGWAIFALLAMVSLWSWRWIEHDNAVVLVQREYFDGVQKLRVFCSPYPTDPYRWHAVVETPDHFQMAAVDTRRGLVTTAGGTDVIYKPETTLATLVAKRSWLGRVYLDWSSWPVVEQTWIDPDGVATVRFEDLRFDYATFLTAGRGQSSAGRQPVLGATVEVDQERRVVEMKLGTKVQR